MKPENRKRVLWIGVGVVVVGLVAFGFWPRAAQVQSAAVERDRLEVVVEEEGRTQVVEEHLVTAPVAAHMRRIRLEPGDPVEAGQVLVELDAPRSQDLDPRSREEAEARARAASAGLEQAREQARAARAVAERAREERARQERLLERGSATRQTVERAHAEAEQAEAHLAAAEAAERAAEAQVAVAEATLRPSPADAAPAGAPIRTLTAPAGGRVLAVHRRSAGHVAPGELLLEVGDLQRLEVWTDVLSRDAIRIRPGARVRLEQWREAGPVLEGVVSRVDPRGFTEVSALGVEEQRVRVVTEIRSPEADREGLGSGYRILSRFVVWEEDDVLQVPTGALFRDGDEWAVFVIEGGRAMRRTVSLGQRAGLAAQVLSGLEEGERVIVHPASGLKDGARVRARD
jgi:HlyD family secretion protein